MDLELQKIATQSLRNGLQEFDKRKGWRGPLSNIKKYKNWKKKYGGNLEFWNKSMKKCSKTIQPNFNTMVIFSTNDFTNHGHPNPLNCPDNISRKSLATYYFSKGRPISEVSATINKNITMFKNRKGSKNDVLTNDNNLKSYLRNLKFFQNLKSFEKKSKKSLKPASNGAYYLPKGNYTLQITNGKAESKQPLIIE